MIVIPLDKEPSKYDTTSTNKPALQPDTTCYSVLEIQKHCRNVNNETIAIEINAKKSGHKKNLSTSALRFSNKYCPCTRLFFLFTVIFLLFWLDIIFVVSQRDPPLDITIYEEGVENVLPDIEIAAYYKKMQTLQGRNTHGRQEAVVPKLFHQLWKSKVIPAQFKKSHSECQKLNSEYKLILWTDEMIYNFIYTHYPWFYDIFISYPYHIQRVDVARYFILYHYGGVYLDMDAACKVPFRVILKRMSSYEEVLLPMTDIYGVTNSFMVAKPHSSFFKHVIFELPSHANGPYILIRHTMIIFSTGPLFLSNCIKSFHSPSDIHVISIHDYDETYFSHYKSGTWHSYDTEIIDVFHFHYLKLLIIVICVAFMFGMYKFINTYSYCSGRS